jgi:Ca-activated chloride channel homolog
MKMFTTLLRLLVFSCIAAGTLLADGLMRPSDKSYPKDFLRLRMTKIDVTINGQIAVTKVYQEFVNEWQQKTNAVFSFPLPADARATDFFFWSNDTMYRAVLKVKEQAVNPGTGEGGIDALLNAYLGSNPLRVLVNDVPAGQIQKTQLEYISLCSYDQGHIQYTYPLNTQDFVTTPIETFSLSVHINAAGNILDNSLAEYPDARTTRIDARHIEMTLDKSKLYPTKNLTIGYSTINDSLSVDFYSADNDSLDGHFVLFVTPPSTFSPSQALNKNVVFLLDRSSSTFGIPLDQGKAAIQQCLNNFRPSDYFNIIAMNQSVASWKPQPVPATAANILSATNFLTGITASGNTNLASGITTALGMCASDTLSNAIMLFSDGMASVDPKVVAAQNTHQTGIFPIAIGTTVNRQRLEMIAYQNFGFPTFLLLTDPVYDNILRVLGRVNDPILKNSKMEFGSNVYDVLPQTLQTVYNGSRFFITGRYKNPAVSSMSIAGFATDGPRFFNYSLNFTADKTVNRFAEKFWGKEKIDAVERQIAVYGATDSLKQLAIKYSLLYNIRCQYTAYIADKTNPVVSGVDEVCGIEKFTLDLNGASVTLHYVLRQKDEILECGVYRSFDPSSGFTRIGTIAANASSFTDSLASGMPAYYRIEIVTRSGRRITSTTLSTLGTLSPTTFELLPNYPNPFNPSTSIRFSVPTAQTVQLKIYDLLGRDIATLVNERMQPGVYARTWNAGGVPSGVYLSVLRAGAFSAVQKMILQK